MTDVVSDEGQTSGPAKLSFSSGLTRVIISALWLAVFAFGVGVLADMAIFQTAKAQLTNKDAYQVYATLLGLSIILWAVLPVFFGYLSSRWIGKDSLFAAPFLAAAVFAIGSFLGLAWPNIVALPLWSLFLYVALTSFAGAAIGGLIAARKNKKNSA